MPKLNQILAIEKGERQKAAAELTTLHRKAEKPELYEGRVRSYKPANEEGEKLPDEVQLVQVRQKEVLAHVTSILTPAWDIVATKDWANAESAHADVVLEDGTVLLTRVPVSYLLWLEKELNDLLTFVKKMPTLDPSEHWLFSSEQNVYITKMAWTNRTRKQKRVLEKSPATEKHPAQVEVFDEDVVIGRFEAIRMSGAFKAEDKERILDRITSLRKSVLFAREQANSVEAERKTVAKKIFDHLFG